jgi:hypothetical protein
MGPRSKLNFQGIKSNKMQLLADSFIVVKLLISHNNRQFGGLGQLGIFEEIIYYIYLKIPWVRGWVSNGRDY